LKSYWRIRADQYVLALVPVGAIRKFLPYFPLPPVLFCNTKRSGGCCGSRRLLALPNLLADFSAAFWTGARDLRHFPFQWVWGDWFAPNIFLSVQKTTLSVFINSGVYSTPQGYAIYTLQMAATMVYLLPMLIIFLFDQKYIVQGIVTSGLKG
jgi:hypothetical protein